MLGAKTILRPRISWIKRKKSFKSTCFKLTDSGSPVNLGRADVEGVAAAVWGSNDVLWCTSGFSDALVGVVVSKTASVFSGLNLPAAFVARISGSTFAVTDCYSGVITVKSRAFGA